MNKLHNTNEQDFMYNLTSCNKAKEKYMEEYMLYYYKFQNITEFNESVTIS